MIEVGRIPMGEPVTPRDRVACVGPGRDVREHQEQEAQPERASAQDRRP
jgi:hypothetical protein